MGVAVGLPVGVSLGSALGGLNGAVVGSLLTVGAGVILLMTVVTKVGNWLGTSLGAPDGDELVSSIRIGDLVGVFPGGQSGSSQGHNARTQSGGPSRKQSVFPS